eukprot:scaffold2097_cov403-Prasinococcus_capsulatus_cf.AAC.1
MPAIGDVLVNQDGCSHDVNDLALHDPSHWTGRSTTRYQYVANGLGCHFAALDSAYVVARSPFQCQLGLPAS